jgi:hypothetical protein
MSVRPHAKELGVAIIGGGRVGLFRGEVANRHPAVKWIGLAEKNPNRAGEVAAKVGADFVTQSHVELLKRPEVTCAIIATDEHLHVEPILAAAERGIPLLIEKPLATDLGAVSQGPENRQGRKHRRSRRLYRNASAANGSPARKGALRRARGCYSRNITRLHEPACRDRQLQAHRRSLDHIADGDLRHARARHVHVVPRKENAGRSATRARSTRCWARSIRASMPPPA